MKTAAIIGIGLSFALAAGCSAGTEQETLGEQQSYLGRSTSPPGGIAAGQAPQFVLVSFDDNFSSEGMSYVTSLFGTLSNPAGTGNPATFDGSAARTTFYHNSTYLSGAQSSWAAAVSAGHETGDHTVNHGQGLSYTTSQWTTEIGSCRSQLMSGLSLTAAQISGFRAPYLAYNDAMFTVLGQQSPAFVHDTSIQSCWATAEGAGSCPWPYTLDAGSADAATVVTKFGAAAASVGAHAGIWEVPVTALVVPPDSVAAQYGFTSGLRSRVQTAIAGKAAPSFYESSSGKIAGLDITLIVDASMNKAEALATLKYNLDLHLAGNRAPLAFVAHTHVYASGYAAAVNVPSMADRRAILAEFFSYALTKSAVRIRPTKDVVSWMQNPVALGGACVPSCSGKTCGSNGCGGSCGTCSGGQTCNASQQCTGGGGGTCNPAWVSGGAYTAGSLVSRNSVNYQCRPWPNSGWCPSYDPASGFGADAWTSLGACTP